MLGPVALWLLWTWSWFFGFISDFLTNQSGLGGGQIMQAMGIKLLLTNDLA